MASNCATIIVPKQAEILYTKPSDEQSRMGQVEQNRSAIQKKIDQIFKKIHWRQNLSEFEACKKELSERTQEIGEQMDTLRSIAEHAVSIENPEIQSLLIKQIWDHAIVFFLQKQECDELIVVTQSQQYLNVFAHYRSIQAKVAEISKMAPGLKRLNELESVCIDLLQLKKVDAFNHLGPKREMQRLQFDAYIYVLQVAEALEKDELTIQSRSTLQKVLQDLRMHTELLTQQYDKLSLCEGKRTTLPDIVVKNLQGRADLLKEQYKLSVGVKIWSEYQAGYHKDTWPLTESIEEIGYAVLGFQIKVQNFLKLLFARENLTAEKKDLRDEFLGLDTAIKTVTENLIKSQVSAVTPLVVDHKEGVNALLQKARYAFNLFFLLTEKTNIPFIEARRAFLEHLEMQSIESFCLSFQKLTTLQKSSAFAARNSKTSDFIKEQKESTVTLIHAILLKTTEAFLTLSEKENDVWNQILCKQPISEITSDVIHYLLKKIASHVYIQEPLDLELVLILSILKKEAKVLWQQTLQNHPVLAYLQDFVEELKFEENQFKKLVNLFQKIEEAQKRDVSTYAHATLTFFQFHDLIYKRAEGQHKLILKPMVDFASKKLNALATLHQFPFQSLLWGLMSACIEGVKINSWDEMVDEIDRLMLKEAFQEDFLLLLYPYLEWKVKQFPERLTQHELKLIGAQALIPLLDPHIQQPLEYAKLTHEVFLFNQTIQKALDQQKPPLQSLLNYASQQLTQEAMKKKYPINPFSETLSLEEMQKKFSSANYMERMWILWEAVSYSLNGNDIKDLQIAKEIEKTVLSDLKQVNELKKQSPILALITKRMIEKAERNETFHAVELQLAKEALNL